ncbi:MAG: cation:proton antiporter [Firmicutes bacterium]|nr:cation:proton antiporter [Bacillota bacterium]
MHIPALITDLAIIMLTAGIIAIVFKKIKQPLVLGYILAGFLISPFFPWFSTISDQASISTWSEIGIIFIMFHLGLEFDLHKMASTGSTAIITCLAEVIGMTLLGYLAGSALGFSDMDSVVLGGMLAMSSTMVILKVYDEMGIRGKFTENVIGTLVIEDIVGIFFMVILSTISVSRNVSGAAVAGHLGLMILYLVIWLILGIFFLPTFLDKTVKYMNDEMLIVTSLGILFGMVIIADKLGFSTALGAFLAGSLLAGTVHVERIEHLTRGIKDMFGAIFFISVGMMVDPSMITKYWLPIIVIFLVTVIGQPIFGTLGMLLSGQTLENSVKGGFSFAQIGEFSFIIASLGVSLGVLDSFLYPIAVAVSVATILTTPIYIKNAPRIYSFLDRKLPEGIKNKLNRMTSDNIDEAERDSDWENYLKNYFLRLLIFGGIMAVVTLVGVKQLYPFLLDLAGDVAAKVITCLIIYGVIAVFLRPLIDPRSTSFTTLWLKRSVFRLPLVFLSAVKLALVALLIMIPLRTLFGAHPLVFVLVIAAAIPLFIKTDFISTWYLDLETAFLRNYNEKLIKNEEARGRSNEEWLDKKLRIMSFIAESRMGIVGKTLKDTDWGSHYNVYAVKIRRGSDKRKQILVPEPDTVITEGSKIYMVGEDQDLKNFVMLNDIDQPKPFRTLHEFMETGYEDTANALAVSPIRIRGDEPFCGKPIRQSNIKERFRVTILGLQTGGLPILMPDPNMLLKKDDILWIMGSNKNVGTLISDYVDEAD